MQTRRGDWVSKIGAEGVQGIGIRSAGIGIAIKVADGNKRALRPVIAATLEALGLLARAPSHDLDHWRSPAIRNDRGTVTGAIQLGDVRKDGVRDAIGNGVARGRATALGHIRHHGGLHEQPPVDVGVLGRDFGARDVVGLTDQHAWRRPM
mgnify:CR=1 FL=1